MQNKPQEQEISYNDIIFRVNINEMNGDNKYKPINIYKTSELIRGDHKILSKAMGVLIGTINIQ